MQLHLIKLNFSEMLKFMPSALEKWSLLNYQSRSCNFTYNSWLPYNVMCVKYVTLNAVDTGWNISTV